MDCVLESGVGIYSPIGLRSRGLLMGLGAEQIKASLTGISDQESLDVLIFRGVVPGVWVVMGVGVS